MPPVDAEQQFREHYERNLDRALVLRNFTVAVVGAGATGSLASAELAHSGLHVSVVDRDFLSPENLLRHYLTDPRLVGQSKSHALARRLRSELPAAQSIRGIRGDIDLLTDEQLRRFFDGVALILCCTGHDALDRRLNEVGRDLGIPLLIPSMWAGGPAGLVGDLLVVPWHLANWSGACFECLRPEREEAGRPAEAQAGLRSEVQRLATLTAETALALLLTESQQHHQLSRQLRRRANYFLVLQWPPSTRTVLTRRRRGCPGCSPTRSRATAIAAARLDSSRIRDWAISLVLASAALWHQSVQGLDAIATLAFITSLGLWWRNRLPSINDLSARLSRLLGQDHL